MHSVVEAKVPCMVVLPPLEVGGFLCVPPPLMVTTSGPGAPNARPSSVAGGKESKLVPVKEGERKLHEQGCVSLHACLKHPLKLHCVAKAVAKEIVHAPHHNLPLSLTPPVLVLRQRDKPYEVLVPVQNHPREPAPGALETLVALTAGYPHDPGGGGTV